MSPSAVELSVVATECPVAGIHDAHEWPEQSLAMGDLCSMLDRKINDLRRSMERTLWQAITAIILTEMVLVALMAAVMLGIAEANRHI